MRAGDSGFVSEIDYSDDGESKNGSDDDDEDKDNDADPSRNWPEVHESIQTAIEKLDGKVVPKLNWSAPKDATFMIAENDMTCRTANDIYLLLKGSDFVTHDLDHALDGVVPDPGQSKEDEHNKLQYYLVLRKKFEFNPSMEFRCFVRDRQLIGICQRDTLYYEFLFQMHQDLRLKIIKFYEEFLRDSFPDQNYSFDVYIPPPHSRVWLIDFNPWAIRTDSLLFSWQELLEMDIPSQEKRDTEDNEDSDDRQQNVFPELRLLARDDPMAFNFSSPQYSAHKMPRDVVDAAQGGTGGMGEFLASWKDILGKNVRRHDDDDDESTNESASE